MKNRTRKFKARKKQYPFVGFRVDSDLKARLKRVSKQNGHSISNLVKQCVLAAISRFDVLKATTPNPQNT